MVGVLSPSASPQAGKPPFTASAYFWRSVGVRVPTRRVGILAPFYIFIEAASAGLCAGSPAPIYHRGRSLCSGQHSKMIAGKAAARIMAKRSAGMKGEFGFANEGHLPGSSAGDAYLPSLSSRLCCGGGVLRSLSRKLENAYIGILESFGVEMEQEEPFELTMLSSRQLRQLRWAFNVLDEDGSGTLEGNELEGLIQLVGDNPTQNEAKDLLAWLDTDGDGEISFEEFARAWWKVRAHTSG